MTTEQASVPANFLVLDFADGEYTFRLTVEHMAELQEKCGHVGIGEIYARLMAGRYRDNGGRIVLNPLEAKFKYEDIAETIRLALIGGGGGTVNGDSVEVTPTKALALVRGYVHPRPLLETWMIASAVLSAFVMGYDDPTAQKKSAKADGKQTAG
jgi:hypothetical protein